ncbi:MAG: tRNA (adenosine(37)-N6)-dimethylallyltransferase MiaA [Patescibacteria group bacterium]
MLRLYENKIIIIVGPTASGKSALAVKIAKKINGEIISADSRQVYKKLNLASGKIAKKEMKDVKHYCLDLVSPKTVFTAERFQKCARKAIKTIRKRGKIPIIAGGTGFYIDAALGLVNIPKVPPDWKLRKLLEKKSAEELFKMLKKLNPERSKTVEPKNKRRLIRAIEIAKFKNSKKTKKSEPASLSPVSDQNNILWLGIKTEPEELRKKINKRLNARLKAGMVAEIGRLHRQGVSWKRLGELGLEPKWIAMHLRGQISKEEMISKLRNLIWRYSRRQETWFKKNKKIRWIKNK